MLLKLLGTGITNATTAQVFFNAIPAPILAADATRLLVRAPAEIAGQSSARIQVFDNATLIGELPAAIVDAAPALFDSIVNEDGSINSPANPAARGSIVVLFATGEGVTGAPISLSIAGVAAEILYAGPVLGYPGLLQINARITSGYIPPGITAATLAVGILQSPAITIAVN